MDQETRDLVNEKIHLNATEELQEIDAQASISEDGFSEDNDVFNSESEPCPNCGVKCERFGGVESCDNCEYCGT